MKPRAGDHVSRADRNTDPRGWHHTSRRVIRTAFLISAVVHILAIALYPVLFRELRPDNVSFPIPASTEEVEGLEVIQLVEIDEIEPLEQPPVPEVEAPEEPEADVGDPVLDDRPNGPILVPPPERSAAERLRPRLTDSRIWAPLNEALGALTDAQREELLVAGRLQEWYDSVTAVRDAERSLTDWTFTDADGKRWGVSDGRIHLGDFSLPLPFDFGVNNAQRDVINQRLYQFEEIQRQGQTMEIRESWRERSEAIRARRDRERAAGDSIRSRFDRRD